MFYPEGFANFGYFYGFLLKSHFFYTSDVGRNGYWRNIVTTSLFMTLLYQQKYFFKLTFSKLTFHNYFVAKRDFANYIISIVQ